MRVVAKCRIRSVQPDPNTSPLGDKLVALELEATEVNCVQPDGKLLKASLEASVCVKPVIANQLKLGSIIKVELTLDE